MWGGAGGREVYDYTLLQQALCISWSFPIPTPYSHGVAAVCGHPHGIACFSYVANLFIEATGFSKIFPGGHLAQCLQGQAGIMHLHAGAVGASVPALSGRTTEGLYPLLYLPPQAHFFTPVHRPPPLPPQASPCSRSSSTHTSSHPCTARSVCWPVSGATAARGSPTSSPMGEGRVVPLSGLWGNSRQGLTALSLPPTPPQASRQQHLPQPRGGTGGPQECTGDE